MSTIDAAKYHHGNGAETEEDGAYHIGLSLRFCAERRLASLQTLRWGEAIAASTLCGAIPIEVL